MRIGAKTLGILLFLAVAPLFSGAQCTSSSNPCSQVFPRLVKFSGVLKNAAGFPLRGVLAVKFVVYSESTGGTPLWQETQNAEIDPSGRYEVLLGANSSEGVPKELFATTEPRWLAVQALLPGRDEEPRVLLSSVPYALQAENAQTLGGLPASAFAKVNIGVSSESVPGTSAVITNTLIPSATTTATTPPTTNATNPATSAGSASASGPTAAIVGRVGPVNVVPKFSGAGLATSQITDANGSVSMQNLSNIIFADRFSGGVPDAVAACPTNGCVISAMSPSVNLNLGTIDPGTKAITIYLGPYTFSVKQITLRMSLKIIGMGASGGAAGTPTCPTVACNGTALQSVNGNNPVFVLPQANNTPATNVTLSGFRVYGAAGNTNGIAFLLDSSSTTNTGLRNSTLDDISVSGFNGIGIDVKGRPNDFLSATQWVFFNNVVVIRNQGGGNALRLEGASFELRFTNCEFDGQTVGDGTNIYIGGLPSGQGGYPNTIVFEGLVSQVAALAVQIDGAVNLMFYGSHHEALSAGYQITSNTNIRTQGLTITDSYFAGNVGSNGGSGYILNIATTLATGIFFTHNQMFGNADAVVIGTNLASVVYQDNLYCDTCAGPPTSGITTLMSPSTSINIRGAHSIALNSSPTPITTLLSSLGPGEMVTLFTFNGPVTFGAGGNVNLMGQATLTLNGSITFIRNDLLGLLWTPVSQWTPAPSTPSTPTT
jgi:hypothetical protein